LAQKHVVISKWKVQTKYSLEYLAESNSYFEQRTVLKEVKQTFQSNNTRLVSTTNVLCFSSQISKNGFEQEISLLILMKTKYPLQQI